MDGDGIRLRYRQTLLVALRGYPDPDPYGAPVLYVFRTVRNKQAPGGAEFVPELVHNRSGAGSHFAVDLNRDGMNDIVTSRRVWCFRVSRQTALAEQPRGSR